MRSQLEKCCGNGSQVSVFDSGYFFLPSAFTPNGDGLNDIFSGYGKSIIEYELSVYKTSGKKIFNTSYLSRGWDGKINGKVKEGKFTYRATVKTTQGLAFIRKGYLCSLKSLDDKCVDECVFGDQFAGPNQPLEPTREDLLTTSCR